MVNAACIVTQIDDRFLAVIVVDDGSARSEEHL